jgi:phage recombination protein Bet
MNNVVSISTNAANYSAAQIKLIKDTVAKDTNPMEFDLFITVAQRAGLDPFRKQIYALVFNKDKADKRNMSIITGIDGFRVIAARSGRYRPDEDEAAYEYDADLKGPLNPLGIVKATVRIWIADVQREGGWKPVTGWAYWDEFAPIKDEWAENDSGKWKPTGKQTLDTGGNWGRMPRVMLAKCAEAQALRKAFPEDLSGLYETAELDRAQATDLSPSEMIGQLDTDSRLAKIGAANGITFQLFPNGPLESIALGQIADRVMETVTGFGALEQVRWFESANTHPLREFWARAPTDGLALKKHIEAKRAKLEQEATAPQGAA